jgi:hypothetical protein
VLTIWRTFRNTADTGEMLNTLDVTAIVPTEVSVIADHANHCFFPLRMLNTF